MIVSDVLSDPLAPPQRRGTVHFAKSLQNPNVARDIARPGRCAIAPPIGDRDHAFGWQQKTGTRGQSSATGFRSILVGDAGYEGESCWRLPCCY